MRSIRFSLILYFLLLLGAALGAVAYFSYQSTRNALAAKEKSTRELLIKKYEEDKVDVMGKFDTKVLEKARALAPKFVLYYDRIEPLYFVGILGNGPQAGALFNLLPLAEATQPKLVYTLAQMRTNPRLQPPHGEEERYTPVVEEGEFFQTFVPPPRFQPFKSFGIRRSDPAPHETSDTLGGAVWHMDKEKHKAKADQGQPPFDNVNLKSGQHVRRVTLRIPVNWSKQGTVVPPLGPLTDKNYPSLAGVTKDNTPINPPGARPIVYLQYGLDTAPRDTDIANLKAGLDAKLDVLQEEGDQAQAELGKQLLLTSFGAFAALVFGGFWLIRLGLSPLDRLSDAVSKVTEKDFRLPIDYDHLPQELKPIAGRLAATLDQLKRVFEREKQAAADISHELRTPVAALLTTLEITLRKPRSADEYREVLQDCHESGVQISQLVERLLTIARLDAGADLLRPREVDVADLADQCVALVRPLAEARGLHLRVHHHGAASMNADPDKLREVLTNLLHNAIAYNKPDGSIDVQVERNNGTMAMEVRDTGIGISPEARKRIFERFYRADPSRHADAMSHAGLGLAIVKGYVDLMGGSINVDSTEGTGSTFRVCLPVR